jgi:hypothetical protein
MESRVERLKEAITHASIEGKEGWPVLASAIQAAKTEITGELSVGRGCP